MRVREPVTACSVVSSHSPCSALCSGLKLPPFRSDSMTARTDGGSADRWTSPTGRWGWAVYGNNLFDNQYVNSLGTYGMTVLGTVGARVTQPQTYGMEVSVQF